MKNVYLIQVVDNYGPNKFLPLAISYHWLDAISDEYVAQTYTLKEVLIEKENIDSFVSRIEKPDVLVMSCYIWNWNYNCALAERVKELWPDCFIVVGGPQISTTDAFLLKKHPYFDIGVLGENEGALTIILKNLETRNFQELLGISLPGKIISGVTRTKNLDSLPSPILSGFYDQIIDQYETRNQQKFLWQVTIETMRGCPYHCTFCDIGDSYWNKVQMFDLERIYKEIDWISEKQIEYVSVCDSNWGMFDRDLDITRYVIEKKLETGYPKVWDIDWAKNNSERIKSMAILDKNAGTNLFKGITFALQSLNDNTLAAIDRFNLSEQTIRDAMDFYKKNDIKTYSELIWPLPEETITSFTEGLQKLIDMGQEHFLMVHPLSLTPNAPMSDPNYLDKHKLSQKKVPLDTFWLTVDDENSYIVETMGTVDSTSVLNTQEVLDGYMIAHWTIVMYYYGWGHYIMKYLKKQGTKETEFILDLVNYIETSKQGLFYNEHAVTRSNIEEVINKGTFWGRKIDRTYWEYKSATCIFFQKNRQQFIEELTEFLKNVYNINNEQLIEINDLMCIDYNKTYPVIYQTKNNSVIKDLFDLHTDYVEISHEDLSDHTEEEFFRKAYHYQRKNQYWKCSIKSLSKNS